MAINGGTMPGIRGAIASGTFLFASGLLADGVRYAWAPGVPLMLGGAVLVVCSGFGVFSPANSAARTGALS